jgi:hypothetical protein
MVEQMTRKKLPAFVQNLGLGRQATILLSLAIRIRKPHNLPLHLKTRSGQYYGGHGQGWTREVKKDQPKLQKY